MSGISYPPPTENLPIFDATVFTEDLTTPLTIPVANTKYLRYPNAQGTENLQAITVAGTANFNNAMTVLGATNINSTGGLNTTIGTTSVGTTALRGATTNVNAVNINLTGETTVLGTSLINSTGGLDTTIGTLGFGSTNVRGATVNITGNAGTSINVGTVASRSAVHHYSDGNNPTGDVHLNNGTTNNSNTNIHNGNGANPTGIVNIMTGTSNSGNINLGGASTTTTLNGTNKVNRIDGITNTATMTLANNLNTGGSLSLMSNNVAQGTLNLMYALSSFMTGIINIGNYNSSPAIVYTTTNIRGDVNIGSTGRDTTITGNLLSNTLDATAFNSAQTIGSNLTTGSIALGDGLTSGNITMGASQVAGQISIGLLGSRTGDINIGNNMMAGSIKIGNNLGVGSTTVLDVGTSGKGTVYLRGSTVNINNDGIANTNIATNPLGPTNYVSIASSGSNDSASYMNLGSDQLGTTYFRSRTIDINGNGAGNTSIGSTTGSGTITLNKPIKPAYAYSYTTTSIVNEIGARCDYGGTGGAPVTVTGDGQWRYYLYVNSVPTGIYLFQYWVNLGVGATYSLTETTIYQRATAFTTAGDLIGLTPPINQNFANLMPNIANPSNLQTAPNFPIFIDSATPNVAFALKCTTNINPATYHGLTLWRIA